MEDLYLTNKGTRTATIGGTLLSISGNLHLEDLIRTGVLAALGAVVSFLVSVSLKFMLKRLRRRAPPQNSAN